MTNYKKYYPVLLMTNNKGEMKMTEQQEHRIRNISVGQAHSGCTIVEILQPYHILVKRSSGERHLVTVDQLESKLAIPNDGDIGDHNISTVREILADRERSGKNFMDEEWCSPGSRRLQDVRADKEVEKEKENNNV